MFGLDTAWIALIGTVFGGAGLKIIEKGLSRGAHKEEVATTIRKELRAESAGLKEELRVVEKELDQWKEKYFLLLQEYLEVKSRAGDNEPKSKPPDW